MPFQRTIAKLFSKSPFKPLYLHTEKVKETVHELAKLIDRYVDGQTPESETISILEHEADEIKQTIRNALPSRLIMPVARSDLLEFLWQQDQIADNCQDTALLLELMQVDLPAEMRETFLELSRAMIQTAETYAEMMEKLSKVLETSFARDQIEEITALINQVNDREHEADLIERKLVKMIYRGQTLDPFAKYHLIQIVLKIGNVVDHMENAGGRLRIMISR
ncbi:MAG: TIGR00153 family protein [Candidatus Bipolaricaulia bacterium]